MRTSTSLFLATTLLLGLGTTAQAASYDCTKSRTLVEQQICNDPRLGHLDEAMASNYRGMLTANTGDSLGAMQVQQTRWLASRNRCKTNQCLVKSYEQRVDDTCDYSVVSGVHPDCKESSDVQ